MSDIETIKRQNAKDTLEQLHKLHIDDMVERKLETDIHPVVPSTHFSAVSTECFEAYVVGHFYACISLSQSIVEALVKFIAERKGWKPGKDFEDNLRELVKKKFITQVQADKFLKVWNERNNYHHLNKAVETDFLKLKTIAKEKIILLSDIEKDVFGYTIVDGKIRPANPKYWDFNSDGTSPVYLRFD